MSMKVCIGIIEDSMKHRVNMDREGKGKCRHSLWLSGVCDWHAKTNQYFFTLKGTVAREFFGN